MSAESELVVKSNRLIQAGYRLTLVEQQLILFAVCHARETQLGLSKLSLLPVEAQAFAKQFGHNPDTVYRQLKEAADRLFNRYLLIEDTHPKSGKLRKVKIRWVTKIAYTDGAGLIEVAFTKDVVPLITRLEEEFTSYRLERVSNMSSIYAIRIYELLVQFQGIGKRKFELPALKEMLDVAKEYKVINDFKKRVLDVAVAQINEHSDLRVAYSQTKTGRKVTGVTFEIKSKTTARPGPKKLKAPTQTTLPLEEPAPKSDAPEVIAAIAETKEALNAMKKKAGLRVVKATRTST